MLTSSKLVSMKSSVKSLATASVLALCPLVALAETPLEAPATRLGNFETANMWADRTWVLKAGTHQTSPNTGTGTGSQLYYGGIDYALSSKLKLGFSAQVIEDSLVSPILGAQPPTRFMTYGGDIKYQFVNTGTVSVAAMASVEFLEFRTSTFNTNVSDSNHIIGSLHVPITYSPNEKLQFHITPSVSFLPGDLNGIPYYGTVGAIGAGVSYKPNERFSAFASVNVPFSGGNTIDSNRNITKVPVVTAGLRYGFTPKVALEGYVTNAVGVTPATSILTFYPNGEEPMFGLRVLYTPGKGLRDTYRPTPLATATPRITQLQQDGFTVGSAGVLEPGTFRFSGSGGTDENYAAAVAWGIDRDFQIDAVIEDYARDGSVGLTGDPTPNSARWMAGGRIRMLDQNNGDAFSLSGRVLGGRDTATLDVGVLYVAFPASYEVNDRLTLHAEPKVAAFGNSLFGGLGLGANYEVADGLQLMGEVTGVTEGRPAVWAAGARYDLPGGGVSIDLSATNSIGRYGHGTMVAQDSTRYAVGVSFTTGLFGR